ncbi:hypothetical protein JHS3_21850 [Jeongeupia sp. HS-3]|uniref:helix-turn-helix domain-containing protein n=1 Tax=Jeongeupia sp. HS-3 TaxID=1009682 RepID=UPI0018A61746|nr:helix-turn-helix domain-containing protein [Jeongeupia sp. HS-3]BCL76449.1 hypothetical protein JHS3_21850 [Jeongeupia sp. HS-3]
MQPDLFTPTAAADAIGVTTSTLATWRCRGSGPAYIKRNGKVFYRRADVAAFIASRTTEHGGAQ